MLLRVGQLRVPLGGDESSVVARALRRAGVAEADVESVELVRKSLDRRRGRTPEFVYSFDLHLRDGAKPRPSRRGDDRVRWVEETPVPVPRSGDELLPSRPVVIGAGPAGLFAALILARNGYAPLVLERGSRMNERVRDVEAFHRKRRLHPESNYLFGEGGAGTFSDGKLTCRSKDPRVRLVLDEFRRNSGIEAVSYYYRPHLGSDRVRAVVARLRREIEGLGGEFRFGLRVLGLVTATGRLKALRTSAGDLPARAVIAAPGHSARDLLRALLEDGVTIERKPFQMGFRIEHPQGFVDEAILGTCARDLGLVAADYRLASRTSEGDVFSFCMCPGGEIMPAVHDLEHYNTNGMSWFHRDSGFANSGFVTTVEPERFEGDGIFAGVDLQQRFERAAAEAAGPAFELPAQRLCDWLAGRPSEDLPKTSCRSGARPADVRSLAPAWIGRALDEALAAFDRQMPGFIHREALICGPEARSSSPVRIVRDPLTLQSLSVDGLLPVGEGAGHAGGIVSAAVDGWRAAEALIRRFSRCALP